MASATGACNDREATAMSRLAAADIAMARLIPRRRTAVAAVGLVAAAAVYPLSRRRLGMDAGETVTLAAACAVAMHRSLAARPGPPVAYWASAGRRTRYTTRSSLTMQPITRLPSTYAAACAGADIAMGARLIFATPTQDN